MEIRIDYLPMETAVYVAENGSDFEKIVPGKGNPDYDDFIFNASVIPGVSKIRVVNISTDVHKYFWCISDGAAYDKTFIGEENDLNCCEVTVPSGMEEGATMYVEEEDINSEYGVDCRSIYFKNDAGFISLDRNDFELKSYVQ